MSLPYAEALAGRDPQQVIAETPARLAAWLDGLTPEQAETPPAPGKWNPREVMCHLADCEIAWAWRLRYAYEQDNAVMQPFEQDPWARMYWNYGLPEARATFAALRNWNSAFIAGLRESDKIKPIYHPERGPEVLWNLVEIMAGHDLHHLARLSGAPTGVSSGL